MAKAKKKTECTENKTNNLLKGRRIVELTVLVKNLKCSQCAELLSLENVVREQRMGLYSILTINCPKVVAVFNFFTIFLKPPSNIY